MPPVTSDYEVCKAMLRKKKLEFFPAAKVGELLGLTSFQVTARLKGMSGRGLVVREPQGWRLTATGESLGAGEPPPPPPERRVGERRQPIGGLPDDSEVTVTTSCKGWKLEYIWYNERRMCLFTDLNGTEYVEATAFEKADMVAQHRFGFKTRLKLADTSKMLKRIERRQHQLEVEQERRRNG